jgi:hypothetical protein
MEQIITCQYQKGLVKKSRNSEKNYSVEYLQPPLLVQRCNGTSAGLGYLEVLDLSMQILLLGQLASFRTVNSQWGRRIQFLY